MKHFTLFLAAFIFIFTFPVITYASDLSQGENDLATIQASSLDDSDESIVSSSAVIDSVSQESDFSQDILLDKIDVIIHLLGLIFAACLFQIFAIIARLFGWIFTNIFKEIL